MKKNEIRFTYRKKSNTVKIKAKLFKTRAFALTAIYKKKYFSIIAKGYIKRTEICGKTPQNEVN